MQRVCFCKTVSLFNHVLQPSQAIALFYQSLIFSVKHVALIRWISSNVDIPTGLQLLMIDINGNVTIDDELLYKQLSNAKRDVEQQTDNTCILKWISRIVFRLAMDCSISSKIDRSFEFESFNEFLKQFHTTSVDDRSTLSDDDEGISNDDLDDEDISRRAIHRALLKCSNYATACVSTKLSNRDMTSIEMQDIETSAIALYNQEIVQILCNDTLELEIELARDVPVSVEPPPTVIHENVLISYYSVWSALWRNVTTEYLQFNGQNRLRKVSLNENSKPIQCENDRILNEISRRQQNLKKTILKINLNQTEETKCCLHDRLMSEIKQKHVLKSIGNRSLVSVTSSDSTRKRIRPIKTWSDSDLSDDDDDNNRRDKHGRKRVAVIDCLLELSSPDDNMNDDKPLRPIVKKRHLMQDNSDTLSLTFDEFSHIRNVITRAELETLFFDEKLYVEVAQGKLCFTCRKIHFNLFTFTFGIQCNVCKQKVCRSCVTQIGLPDEILNNVPVQTFTPSLSAQSIFESDRSRSLGRRPIRRPMMVNVVNDRSTENDVSRRYSTPPGFGESIRSPNKRRSKAIDICTDCLFILHQIRKKGKGSSILSEI